MRLVVHVCTANLAEAFVALPHSILLSPGALNSAFPLQTVVLRTMCAAVLVVLPGNNRLPHAWPLLPTCGGRGPQPHTPVAAYTARYPTIRLRTAAPHYLP